LLAIYVVMGLQGLAQRIDENKTEAGHLFKRLLYTEKQLNGVSSVGSELFALEQRIDALERKLAAHS
jgi:hypothetical protein